MGKEHESEEEVHGFLSFGCARGLHCKLVDRCALWQRIARCDQANCWRFSFKQSTNAGQFLLKALQEGNLFFYFRCYLGGLVALTNRRCHTFPLTGPLDLAADLPRYARPSELEPLQTFFLQ
ncbi:hypothetical protein AVEN_254119-1 [Araneus ventricosus]|uniref:Uncharacterized protein n=1 Tax=Araneus ventricosus TaxID=182803 RepID=A0A4Y2BZY1_ARAVE|nr:hypothetical protein AVEN_254119-1 [Araneus ventricosus]